MATAEEITIANKTSRGAGNVGRRAIVPAFVDEYVTSSMNIDEVMILDFGAGKTAVHARNLLEMGFAITAFEFGDNVDPRYHNELALMQKYDVVYASNVLNVQASTDMLKETLEQIRSVMQPHGVFIANYPASPRKNDMDVDELMDELRNAGFTDVHRVGGGKKSPLLMMRSI